MTSIHLPASRLKRLCGLGCKPRAFLIHGFNVWDPMRSVGKLVPYFEAQGFEVVVFRYGWQFLFGSRFENKYVARRLVRESRVGDIVVGHSNGCCIIHMASQMAGAQFSGAVYINPALDPWLAPGPNVQFCHVWHSPSDEPVKWAKLRPFMPWGEMGATGYRPRDGEPDRRMSNFNKETGFNGFSSDEHSDVFRDDLLEFFGPMIAKRATLAYEAAVLSGDLRKG